MNERIRELWYQAVQPHTGNSWAEQTAFMEEFAKLIMEEMYVFMCNATDNDKPWPSFKEVKEHFGVEK